MQQAKPKKNIYTHMLTWLYLSNILQWYFILFHAHLLQMYCWPGCQRFSHSHRQPLGCIHLRITCKSICKELKHASEYHRQHYFGFIFKMLLCGDAIAVRIDYLILFIYLFFCQCICHGIWDFRAFTGTFWMQNNTVPRCDVTCNKNEGN